MAMVGIDDSSLYRRTHSSIGLALCAGDSPLTAVNFCNDCDGSIVVVVVVVAVAVVIIITLTALTGPYQLCYMHAYCQSRHQNLTHILHVIIKIN